MLGVEEADWDVVADVVVGIAGVVADVTVELLVEVVRLGAVAGAAWQVDVVELNAGTVLSAVEEGRVVRAIVEEPEVLLAIMGRVQSTRRLLSIRRFEVIWTIVPIRLNHQQLGRAQQHADGRVP